VRLVWDGSLPAAPGTHPMPCATAVAAGAGSASAAIEAALGTIFRTGHADRGCTGAGRHGDHADGSSACTCWRVREPEGNRKQFRRYHTGSDSERDLDLERYDDYESDRAAVAFNAVAPGTATITATLGFASSNVFRHGDARDIDGHRDRPGDQLALP